MRPAPEGVRHYRVLLQLQLLRRILGAEHEPLQAADWCNRRGEAESPQQEMGRREWGGSEWVGKDAQGETGAG